MTTLSKATISLGRPFPEAFSDAQEVFARAQDNFFLSAGRFTIQLAENLFAFKRGEFAGAPPVKPILGGDTAVTLTSAATLASLGISVKTTGSATLTANGANPIADFRITGGSAGPGSNAVILHNGSGLSLSDAKGTVKVEDFLIDTRNRVVDANVTVNGQSVGNVAVFSIGADGATLSLTATAASVLDSTLGITALSSSTVIGIAAPAPKIDPLSLGLADLRPIFGVGDAPVPVLGGDTFVTLTSAGTLTSLGVSVSALGTARIFASSAGPVADFGITGGTEGPGGRELLLHQGSGLELKDRAGTLDLRDFIVDTKNRVIDANVTANGTDVGNVAVFSIGADGSTLTLTAAGAQAANATLGTSAFNTSIVIGTANPNPFTLAGLSTFG